METSRVTQAIAEILRVELVRSRKNQTWLGGVIGRSQSHVSQVFKGKKPLTVDELTLACKAFGLSVSDVVRQAEGLADDESWAPVPDPRAG